MSLGHLGMTGYSWIPRLKEFPSVRARQFMIIVSLLSDEWQLMVGRDLPIAVSPRLAKVVFV